MNSYRLFLFACSFVSTAVIAQNVGIGTAAPVTKLHVSNGDVLVENGKVVNNVTGIDRALLPIAIASINSVGQTTAGTMNVKSSFSSTGVYIVDIGEDNSNTQAFVTSEAPGTLVGVVATITPFASPSTKYFVRLNSSSTGSLTSSNFSIIVYKTGRDALREYNITIARDTNAITFGNGHFGINSSVDSLTLNIFIPDSVTIGGNRINPAVTFTNLPIKTGIVITNNGQIIGYSGKGGRGDGNYLSVTS